jgi:hypothetical protein
VNVDDFLDELVRRFPLWDQLHPVFGDRTASRPLATGYSGQDDDVPAVLFGGEDHEESDGSGEEGERRDHEKAVRRGRKRSFGGEDHEESDGSGEEGERRAHGKAVRRGKKRSFGEVLVDLARDREEAKSKRTTQMLEYMKQRHDEKLDALVEKTKVEKLVANTALITSLKEAGFSKEEVHEHIRDT